MDKTHVHDQGINDVHPLSDDGDQQPTNIKFSAHTVSVKLVNTVCLLALHSAAVPVQTTGIKGVALLEPSGSMEVCIQVDGSVVEVNDKGSTTVLITNRGKSSCVLEKGTELAQAWEADVLDGSKHMEPNYSIV